MENLTDLLETLATKLGTTTEYLWGVLIRQASINAMINLVYFVFVLLAGVGLYMLHKKFSKEDDDGDSIYSDSDEAIPTIMVIVTIIWIIMFFVGFFSLGSVFYGFFNPEYWALEKVLNVCN